MTQSSDNILRIDDFSFAYPNCSPQLSNVNLVLDRGDFAILGGCTGTGKTTLLKSILGEEYISGARSGTIEVNAEKIGYVAQEIESQLICDSVWHELAFALENYGVDQSIIRRRVAEVSCFFGIDSWFRKKICELSGGQKQLVNLCRAISLGPELLLLDEPTSELDYVAEKNFIHALFRLNRELGITILLSTHSPHLMSDYCNRHFHLNDSMICEKEIKSSKYKSHQNPTDDKIEKTNSAISIDDIYVRYDATSDFVLHGMDAQFEEKKITAIIGGNGSGKSTTLLTIAGILKPIRGSVKNNLKDRQAYLPQHPTSLFVCDTALEELQEWQKSCNYSDQHIDEMLSRIGLDKKCDVHPYDLSGGQKQLLALAKLMLTKPSLLLLDEPTKGLDTRYRIEIAELLVEQCRRGTTIILVSHDLEFVKEVSDVTMQIFDGQISACDQSSTFFEDNLFIKPTLSDFSEIYGHQK